MTQNKKFSIELTKGQIAIIKAGLQYYWLADSYGFDLWVVQGGSLDSDNCPDSRKAGEIYEELEKLTRVEPNYGWGLIKRIAEFCKEDYEKAKKEGEENVVPSRVLARHSKVV